MKQVKNETPKKKLFLRFIATIMTVILIVTLAPANSQAAKKYTNPFQTFQLGKKNFATQFNKKDSYSLGDPGSWDFSLKGNIPVKVKLKKGYKLQKISYTTKEFPFEEKEIKNGSKLNFSKKGVWELHVSYKDTNGKNKRAALLFPSYY